MKINMEDLIFNQEKETITELFTKTKFEELIDLLEDMVNEDPFIYLTSIEVALEMLYSDDERFVRILCILINKRPSDGMDIHPIIKIASSKQTITSSIIAKIDKLGLNQIFCTAILISSLLGQNIIDKETFHNLKSYDSNLQKLSLLAINEFIIMKSSETPNIFIQKILESRKNIQPSNKTIFIDLLIISCRINKKLVSPILKKEIENGGYTVASMYIQRIRSTDDFPISLTKKALKIIESENPGSHLIDLGLTSIYKNDKNFVIEKMRDRLDVNRRPIHVHFRLMHEIKKVDPNPLIRMYEEEIDNENITLINIGEGLLEEVFESNKNWLEWCKKWKNDERKGIIVLKSLRRILTEFLYNYDESSVRDDAIVLVREFANKKGLDYVSETKKIDLGKDSHEGAKYREDTNKALHILKLILHPTVKIDINILKRNLEKYPYVTQAIGKSWIIKNAQSKFPHVLVFIYSVDSDFTELDDLKQKYEAETENNKKIIIKMLLNASIHRICSQIYWEKVFKTLDIYKLIIPKKKLRDIDNAESILSEAEVLARFAPHFKVEIEPNVPEFNPKKLDALIEFKGQQILIEIASVSERTELEVAGGTIGLSGGKVKGVLLDKLKKQLKNGDVNTKLPIVIVLNLMNGINEYDADNSIYGEIEFQYKLDKSTKEVVEQGAVRTENSFYDEKNSDIVTAVATYKRAPSFKDPLVGRIYRLNPPFPRNSMSKELYLKFRTALYGKSENSDWESLLKVKGIDHELAQNLYDNGIEDLGTFAIALEEDLNINGLDKDNLLKLQNEAKRVIMAIKTDSIRFLNGINEGTFDLLTSKGITLISELVKLDKAPENVKLAQWNVILIDSQRILN
jgi:hypothetical protein